MAVLFIYFLCAASTSPKRANTNSVLYSQPLHLTVSQPDRHRFPQMLLTPAKFQNSMAVYVMYVICQVAIGAGNGGQAPSCLPHLQVLVFPLIDAQRGEHAKPRVLRPTQGFLPVVTGQYSLILGI